MHTDPLTGARYPDSTDAPNIAQYIQNAANDLSAVSSPTFATTTARNTAYANWVALGNTMRNGLLCTVADTPYIYSTTSPAGWRPLAKGIAGGWFTGTTSSGGDVLLSHGLGVTPVTAQITMSGTNNPGTFAKGSIGTITSSIIPIRFYDTRTAAVWASVPVEFWWVAYLL